MVHNTCMYLDTLSFINEGRNNPDAALQTPPAECTLTWFGLLFSILSQLRYNQEAELLKAGVFGMSHFLGHLPYQIPMRLTNSEIHIACCLFQCLRLNNFISFLDTHTIQALILLVNLLQN